MPYDATIYFDGHCLLCSRTVRFIVRNDKKKRYCFVILPEAVNDTPEGFPSRMKAAGSVLLFENGITYRESTAVLRILIGLGFPWSMTGVLLLIPAVLRDSVYRLIAVNRYRWFGRGASCFLPDPTFADRFK